MVDPPRTDITALLLILNAANDNDNVASDLLFSSVFQELHKIAKSLLRKERPDHTLQPTALIHEACIKLVDPNRIHWKNRAQFITVAARANRQILVDQARRRAAAKRGGSWQRITLNEAMGVGSDQIFDTLALDDALDRMVSMDSRMARTAELKIFADTTSKEIAHILDVSTRTVDNDWAVARKRLRREVREGGLS